MKPLFKLVKDFLRFSPSQFDRLSDFTANLSLLLFGTTSVPFLFGALDKMIWPKILLGSVAGVGFLIISLLLAKEAK